MRAPLSVALAVALSGCSLLVDNDQFRTTDAAADTGSPSDAGMDAMDSRPPSDAGADTAPDVSCPTSECGCEAQIDGLPVEDVSGLIAPETVWAPDRVYRLCADVVVREAVLTILPGTRIQAAGAVGLVVDATGLIDAVGTPAEPIVFTSGRRVGFRAAGDWGGIALLGRAPTNTRDGLPPPTGFSDEHDFGGAVSASDCGNLNYVRVEFAGGYDFRSLMLGGCGSDTSVSNVQVHRSAGRSALYVVGGDADLSQLVISEVVKPALAWDRGFVGTVDRVAVRVSATTEDVSAVRGFATYDWTPRSSPRLSRFTLVADRSDSPGARAFEFHRRTGAYVTDSIAVGFNRGLVQFFTASPSATDTAPTVTLENNYFFDIGGDGTTFFTAGSAEERLWTPINTFDVDPIFDEPPSFTAAGAVGTAGAVLPGDTWFEEWTEYPSD